MAGADPAPPASGRIVFLGTGNAFSVDGRFPTSTLLEWNCRRVLFDPGPAILVMLERAGIPISSLDAIFVTHLHGDHVAGMPFLMIKSKFVPDSTGGRPADEPVPPLAVYGPEGTRDRIALLWDAAYPDVADCPMPDVTEIPRRLATMDVLGARVEVVPMVHLPHSIGFRWFLGEKAVAFSGDTDFQECVRDLCRDMDVAVLECTLLEPEAYTHVALAEIRANREHLHCKRLLLNHLDNRIASALIADPIPDTWAMSDGDSIEL